MSGFGYKRTFTHTVIYVRFTPESRHNRRGRCTSACGPKQTSRSYRLERVLGAPEGFDGVIGLVRGLEREAQFEIRLRVVRLDPDGTAVWPSPE